MSAPSTPAPRTPAAESLESVFLSVVLPRVLSHAEVIFRGIRCLHQREECLAEMTALSWLWCSRLAAQGRDVALFPTAVATFAARAVRAGRRLVGQERSKDVLSPVARYRHGFAVCSLPARSSLFGNVFDEALRDNTRTPPDEQAAFRADWPAWLATRSERDRRLIADLALGERTLDAARKHGLSPARISQLRREFMQDWERFCGEGPEQAAAGEPAR